MAGKYHFMRQLEQGNQTEARLAESLILAGIEVEIPEYEKGMATSYYTKNQVDLVANGFILEVKGRNQSFTCVEDFQYPTMFIESVSGFTKKLNVPDYYVNVSNLSTGIIGLDVAQTFDTWKIETITTRNVKRPYDMYLTDITSWFNYDELVRRLKDAK